MLAIIVAIVVHILMMAIHTREVTMICLIMAIV